MIPEVELMVLRKCGIYILIYMVKLPLTNVINHIIPLLYGVSLSPCACSHDLFDVLVSHLEVSENISIFRDTFPNMEM